MMYIRKNCNIEVTDLERRYYINGKMHNDNGPAVYGNFPGGGTFVAWFSNNLHHRYDGPAVEWSNGTKMWFVRGDRHRLDGPAIEYANGDKEWYIDNVEYTENAFNAEIARRG